MNVEVGARGSGSRRLARDASRLRAFGIARAYGRDQCDRRESTNSHASTRLLIPPTKPQIKLLLVVVVGIGVLGVSDARRRARVAAT